MRVRRVRFLPQIDFLTGRVVPSASPVGVAIPPAADPGTSVDGPDSGGDPSNTDPASGGTLSSDPSDGPSYGGSSEDPNLDPMAPGGPVYVDLTDALSVAPSNAYD